MLSLTWGSGGGAPARHQLWLQHWKVCNLPCEWMVPVCPVLWLQLVNIKQLVCCGAQTDRLVVRLLPLSTVGVGLQRHDWLWNAGICSWQAMPFDCNSSGRSIGIMGL